MVEAHKAIAKRCAQNPMEYRSFAMAALDVAAEIGSPAKQECLVKLMS